MLGGLAYQIKRGSSAFPNIAVLLEEHAGSKPLSPEAYSRFRRALGKILWLAQTRQDIKFAVGLLSTQQAEPGNREWFAISIEVPD